MSEVLLDQLPMLADMRRYLEQLSMTDSEPPKYEPAFAFLVITS